MPKKQPLRVGYLKCLKMEHWSQQSVLSVKSIFVRQGHLLRSDIFVHVKGGNRPTWSKYSLFPTSVKVRAFQKIGCRSTYPPAAKRAIGMPMILPPATATANSVFTKPAPEFGVKSETNMQQLPSMLLTESGNARVTGDYRIWPARMTQTDSICCNWRMNKGFKKRKEVILKEANDANSLSAKGRNRL